MSKGDSPHRDEVELVDQTDTDVSTPTLPDKADRLEVQKEVRQVLEANKGLFLTADIIAAVTNYSEGHVRTHLHELADSDTKVERERRYKEIYGVVLFGNFVVLTDDRDQLLEVVKTYRISEFDKAQSMSKSELRSFIIDELASQEVTSKTDKLYFGIPA
ncbi:hypothetical protein NDI85_21505 [Halomicroarcula sp. S1AR25-4]|uniref:hypothetical protein n=1 Tax=Haloarcula sp. S1AR25-4 TaxID=2950538 RepID=UPI00287541C5|nr:hypothetical protein [Halomicroarcula sp. S1AR25-4]MDS0280366.1 hypothetical protein [Halomicroarcula sp. S1AR25-4]